MRTFKEEGLRGMYRGWTPNMMKVIPAVTIVSPHIIHRSITL
jgi:hypothetical protein